MWRRIWLVAWREYLANVKTKTFVVAVLTFPAILGIATFVPIALQRAKVTAKPFFVVGEGDHDLAAELRSAFEANAKISERFSWIELETPPTTLEAADQLVANGRAFAYLWLPKDVVTAGRATYGARNHANRELVQWAHGRLSDLIRSRRFDAEGVSPYAKARIEKRIDVESRVVDESGTGKTASPLELLRAYSPMIFVYVLFVAVMTVAQMLLMNVIEEKSSRVIEVLLSSTSAGELMAGKISGVAATGLTMMGAWVASLLAFVKWGVPLMVPAEGPISAGGVFELAWSLLTGRNLFFFGLYGLLGFLMFSAIFAAIGSLFESIKDAQNLQTPVIFVLMVPVLSMTFITQNPHETLGVALSFFPPFTPFVMMNRVAAIPSAPGWQIGATLALLVASVVVTYWLAGRVFRVGILMTGKSPTPRELWRIVRGR